MSPWSCPSALWSSPRPARRSLHREAGRSAPASRTSRGDADLPRPLNRHTDCDNEDPLADVQYVPGALLRDTHTHCLLGSSQHPYSIGTVMSLLKMVNLRLHETMYFAQGHAAGLGLEPTPSDPEPLAHGGIPAGICHPIPVQVCFF